MRLFLLLLDFIVCSYCCYVCYLFKYHQNLLLYFFFQKLYCDSAISHSLYVPLFVLCSEILGFFPRLLFFIELLLTLLYVDLLIPTFYYLAIISICSI